jgi:hypothetical protein
MSNDSSIQSIINALPELIIALLGSGGIAVVLKHYETQHKLKLEQRNAATTQYDKYLDRISETKDSLVDFLKEQGTIKDNEIRRLIDASRINEARVTALSHQIDALNQERRDDEERYERKLEELERENRMLSTTLLELHRRKGGITGMEEIFAKIERRRKNDNDPPTR